MRRAMVLAVVVGALALPSPASAHPLGNFTVNRYAGVEIAGDTVYLRYALDLAEIPTFQIGEDVRAPGYPVRLARELELLVDGERAPLRVLERRVSTRSGVGGLRTLRLDVVYDAGPAGRELELRDRSLSGRSGWREITVAARDGARLLRSNVPSVSASADLTAYPAARLGAPLDVRHAAVAALPGSSRGVPPAIGATGSPKLVEGGFEALLQRGDLSPAVLVLSLLLAAFWGAAHALTPGHGKALVAAYLVGTRGTARHAFALGATVTLAHTAGVFGLGVVTLALSQVLLPEQLYPWLTLVSGLLVLAVGMAVLRARLGDRHRHVHDAVGHDHPHRHHHGAKGDHVHDHRHGAKGDHVHDHYHGDAALTKKGLLGVGVAAGILPCPSALVVLLSAIALHRVGLGLALVVAFSVGLAATITAIGLVAVLASRAFGRLSLEGRLVQALPAASAALIVVVGLVLTVRAVPGVV